MLKRLLTEDGELTKISRRFVWMLVNYLLSYYCQDVFWASNYD